MTEPTISETYTTIRVEIGDLVGLGVDSTTWSPGESSRVDRCIRAGYKNWLFYATLPDGAAYEWSFLRPSNTLSLTSADFDYDLPDNFTEDVVQVMLTSGGTTPRPLVKIEPDDLIQLRIREAASNGTPTWFSIRPKTPTTSSGDTANLTSSAGQRWEMLFYPTPNGSFTVTYHYAITPNMLTSTNVYPLGGAQHSGTVLAACLAAAEDIFGMEPKRWEAEYQKRLVASIVADRRLKKSEEEVYPATAVTVGSYDWLAQEIGRELDFGPNQALWNYAQSERVRHTIQQGLIEFYKPSFDGVEDHKGHRWSFLDSVTTLTTDGTQSSSTVTIVSGVVTLASGTWPSWAAQGHLLIDGLAYEVSTRDSPTQLTLLDTTLNASAGETYVLMHWTYDLPSTFSALDTSMITFEPGRGLPPLEPTTEDKIRHYQQYMPQYGYPRQFAVRTKTPSTSGTSRELLLWPVPNGTYTLTYRFKYPPVQLSSGQTPLGGTEHATTILASCLAITDPAKWQNLYIGRLQASIEIDQSDNQSHNLGMVTDRSDEFGGLPHRHVTVTSLFGVAQ